MNSITQRIKSVLPRPARPYRELQRLVQWYDSERSAPQILLFGDSVTERVSIMDKDKRNLGGFVEKEFENRYRLACLSHSAYHMKIYRALLEVLRSTRQKPGLVILPINVRSFSPQWDFEPSWQFEREIELIRNYVSDPFKVIPILAETVVPQTQYEEFDATEVSYPLTNSNRICQFRLIINGKPQTQEQFAYRKKQIFIFHYLHTLASEHPKLLHLLAIVRLLRELDINLLLYVTPINYQAGERYAGSEFTELLNKNTQVIRDALIPLESEMMKFFDLSTSLASDKFFTLDDATEHLNQYGRAELAVFISRMVFDKFRLHRSFVINE